MKCNIGLISEFMKKHPSISTREDLPHRLEDSWLFGYANIKRKEMWVFVDEISIYHGLYYGGYPKVVKKIIDDISSVVIHELIHLNGIEDEKMTEFGENLVMENEV